MKKVAGLVLPCLLLCGGAMVAQDMSSDTVMPAPKVLLIMREFVKPGKAGAIHEKSESAFVNAARTANWSTHYVAVNSMSGRSRSATSNASAPSGTPVHTGSSPCRQTRSTSPRR